MLFFHRFHRTLPWLNLPAGILIALLQRTPVVRLVQAAGDYVAVSPAGQLLRAAFTVTALGALHSRAGATTFVTSSPNPVAGTVGTQLSYAFTYTGTPSAPQFFNVSGQLPPGLSFIPAASGGVVRSGNPAIAGTPTQAGSFTVFVQGVGLAGQGGQEAINFNITGGVVTTAPAFTVQPQSVTVAAGGTATFTSAAGGSPAPLFQWRKDGVAITGATNATLTIQNVQAANAGVYSVVASNSAGTATSDNASLTLAVTGVAPTIVSQPIGFTAAQGGTAVLTVVASGTPAPTYRWRRGGVLLAGATEATLRLNAVTAANAGAYTVEVSNAAGAVTSAAANVAVAAGQGRLANLSVRANLGTGGRLFVGFATNGGKNVLVRGIGPTLGDFGVGGAYADPKLELFQDATKLTENEDWNVALSPVFASVGAFALTNGSKDAALQAAVTGSRTAQLSGPGAGVVLVEVYDSGSGTAQRLVNVSARNIVGTGDNIMIAGFVVDGPVARTLLIRAVGPTLAAFGVGGTLADPKLEIYRDATKLVENDNWSASLSSTFGSVGAFALVDGSRDAALLVTLPPGAYSAQVSGIAGGTGEALVEVYEVP